MPNGKEIKRKDDTIGKLPTVFHWKFHGREYIKADGIFQRVVSHKGKVYRVQSIGSEEVTYLVTDGGGKWSHGDTLADAKRDLMYKLTNRDTTKYEGWSLNTEVTMAEAIEAYRIITGACEAGTRYFVENVLSSDARTRKKLTVREVIEYTKEQYNAEAFANFFKE